jgi:hypothetical protein
MNQISSFVKKRDLFGHIIQLNFNQKGSSHNTVIGGATSIIIKAFMAFFIWVNLEKLVFNLDDKNTS